jgi:hypothetical protein
MSNREPITVEVYWRLLDLAKDNLVATRRYRSIAHILQDASVQYLENRSLPLPYNPMRFKKTKLQQKLCDELFPRRKTVVAVNKELFYAFKHVLTLKSAESYQLGVEEVVITNRYAVECALWLALKTFGSYVFDSYFDDRIQSELDVDVVINRSLRQVTSLLGRSPTAREYAAHCKEVGGPSLSFIKSVCGSFNEAKKQAGLIEG